MAGNRKSFSKLNMGRPNAAYFSNEMLEVLFHQIIEGQANKHNMSIFRRTESQEVVDNIAILHSVFDNALTTSAHGVSGSGSYLHI